MLSGPDTVVLLVVALLVFGPKKLPEMGKSLGKTIHDLRDAMEGRVGDPDAPRPVVAETPRPVVTEAPPHTSPTQADLERAEAELARIKAAMADKQTEGGPAAG